jgi:cullin 3
MYTSKLKRVKIPLISSKDAAVLNGGNSSSLLSSAKCCGDNVDAIDISNSAVVSQFVEEDRRHILEAVIVRIMKARKQLAHNDLISEVVRQTSHRFTSDVQVCRLY